MCIRDSSDPVHCPLRKYAWQGATLSLFPARQRYSHHTSQVTELLHLKASVFQYGIADAAAVHGRRGSNVYEVNPWLWQFGRCRPRLGGLSVSETKDKRKAIVRAGAKRSQETRRRREAARRGDE